VRLGGGCLSKVESADAVTGFSFAGCAHGKKSSLRQVLLVDKETLDAMDLRPGRVRENITTEGIHVNNLALGEHLRIGPVLLQVSAVCTPCDQLEKVRPGLRREIYGRCRMLCQVLQGGTIRAGDAIARVAAISS
jgi:MOSC domain-containing protein YiiM